MGRRAVTVRISVASVGNESAGVHTVQFPIFFLFSISYDESPISDGIYPSKLVHFVLDSKLYRLSQLPSYPFAFGDPTSVLLAALTALYLPFVTFDQSDKKRQRQKREFNIVMSGQFFTLVIFSFIQQS